MHGAAATKRMYAAMNEAGASDAFCPLRDAYYFLDEAALEFCREARILYSTVEITTVEGQQTYSLPPDFLELFERTMARRRLFGRYETVAGNVSRPQLTTLEKIRLADKTENEDVPTSFAIEVISAPVTKISGTASSTAAKQASGESVLTVATDLFADVYPRDVVMNLTDGSTGVVVEKSTSKILYTALFEGTNDDWTTGDSFYIIPSRTHELILNAPSANAGDKLRLEYAAKPEPLFSSHRTWRIPEEHCPAICQKAAALFCDSKKELVASQYLHATYGLEINKVKMRRARQRLSDSRYSTSR